MIIKVVCAIVEQHGRVLITQRSETMPQPLLWEFPGGKLEAGETEEECLIREIKEELHIVVQPSKRLTPVRHNTTKERTIKLIPYICRFTEGTIQLLEHRDYRWVEAKELTYYNWCAPDVPVVAEYLRLLEEQ